MLTPPGDDQFGGPAGQEEPAVLILIAHVAHGEVVTLVGLGRLLGRLEVLEPVFGRHEVDGPDLSSGNFVSPLVEDSRCAAFDDLPHGAGPRQPVPGVDEVASTFGGRVVLVDDRAQPVDQGLFDVNGAGGGAMQEPTQGRQVVRLLDLLGEGQHAVEHRRDHVAVGDAVTLDQSERFGSVPFVHQDLTEPGAEGQAEIEAERSGVVERPGDQGDVARRIEGRCLLADDIESAELRAGLPENPFRSAGGARGVEHHAANAGILEIAGIFACQRVRVRGEAVDLAADGEAQAASVGSLHRGGRGVAEGRIGDEDAGFAVIHDVGHLRGGQVPVDRSQPRTDPQACLVRLDELRPVAGQQGDRVTGPDAEGS